MGNGSPQGALEQLQKSNNHCKNMMDPDFNMLGVGYFRNPSSKYGDYWTDSFGAWHRGPDQSCIGGSPAPSPAPGCADIDTNNCGYYKSQGYCRTSPNVQAQCKDTCGIGNCAAGSSPQPSQPSSGSCRDTVGSCDYYRKHGYCASSPNVKAGCKKTCGLCGGSCVDIDGACAYYLQHGYCSKSENVKKQCRKTCGLC